MKEWITSKKSLYQPVRGFEYKTDINRRIGYENTFYSIYKYCNGVSGKQFLDIGSNAGWFSFRIADNGGLSTGIEMDDTMIKLSRYLTERDKYTSNPIFIEADSKQWVKENNRKFDYVLLLNVFHHILAQDEESAWSMFNKLISTSNGVFVAMRTKIKEGYHLCDKVSDIPSTVVKKSTATSFDVVSKFFERTLYVFKNDIVK